MNIWKSYPRNHDNRYHAKGQKNSRPRSVKETPCIPSSNNSTDAEAKWKRACPVGRRFLPVSRCLFTNEPTSAVEERHRRDGDAKVSRRARNKRMNGFMRLAFFPLDQTVPICRCPMSHRQTDRESSPAGRHVCVMLTAWQAPRTRNKQTDAPAGKRGAHARLSTGCIDTCARGTTIVKSAPTHSRNRITDSRRTIRASFDHAR